VDAVSKVDMPSDAPAFVQTVFQVDAVADFLV